MKVVIPLGVSVMFASEEAVDNLTVRPLVVAVKLDKNELDPVNVCVELSALRRSRRLPSPKNAEALTLESAIKFPDGPLKVIRESVDNFTSAWNVTAELPDDVTLVASMEGADMVEAKECAAAAHVRNTRRILFILALRRKNSWQRSP